MIVYSSINSCRTTEHDVSSLIWTYLCYSTQVRSIIIYQYYVNVKFQASIKICSKFWMAVIYGTNEPPPLPMPKQFYVVINGFQAVLTCWYVLCSEKATLVIVFKRRMSMDLFRTLSYDGSGFPGRMALFHMVEAISQAPTALDGTTTLSQPLLTSSWSALTIIDMVFGLYPPIIIQVRVSVRETFHVQHFVN